jgi:hypothetical protein
MNDFDSDGPSENEWEEQGELAWNEFDWERYLRERGEDIERYLECYGKAVAHPERLDEAARLMGWDAEGWNDDEISESLPPEPYTFHRNPVFISTRALFVGLRRSWEPLARDPDSVPRELAISFLTALHSAEMQSLQAIQALDLGDFTLAVSVFKRSLVDLNACFALADDRHMLFPDRLAGFRAAARPMLFDLREVWLRVMGECRDETTRPLDGGL